MSSQADTKEILLRWVKTPEKDRKPLTPKQEEIYMRVIQMCTLIERHRLDKDAVAIHLEIQAMKDEIPTLKGDKLVYTDGKNKISQAVAYEDLHKAKYLLGEINRINTRFERYTLSNWQKEMMVKAEILSDIRGFNGGAANLIKVLGLDRPDEIPIDYTQMTPVRPIFGFFPEIIPHENVPEDHDEFLEKMRELRSPAKFKKTVDVEDINYEEAS